MPSSPLSIDVVSDVVCPWCYIGKRRLAAALELVAAEGAARGCGGALASVRAQSRYPARGHRPAGLPRGEIRRCRARGADATSVVRAAGDGHVGIAFEFERIERVPNTRDAHRLIEWAQDRGDAGPLVERLFVAFFIEGRDLGDRTVLAAIAGEAGHDARDARAMLDSEANTVEVADGLRWAQDVGIGGVPFFIFGGRYAVSGAQVPELLAQAIAKASEAGAV